MSKNKNTISPREANTRKKLMSLHRDNKDFLYVSLMVSENTVSIFPDKWMTTGWITITKKDFNRMINWYNKKQKARKQ